MRSQRTALIIPARLSQAVRIEIIDTTPAARQSLIDGNVEAFTCRDWHVYLNDEADFIPLPQNVRAEVLIREAGLHFEEKVSGTAVFLGHGDTGDETDAPAHLLRLAEHLFGTAWAA
ncbi:hypothetical protein [Pseudarthrobacter sp. PH31-O2]|uniref:DUF3846 domain-containing protein n=1 Tax=Pseudarthrobacter sp. PH31-O2 TaxID=3046206 RepID=UPI0024BB6658|nr:hypothetical protein [Pseudarthrobacter sp. PH31-O2]MDJ0353971.1 hypothetical protein [Pseudarthrobacter sp. PH31-O2]